jgi:transposase InsO family protein
MCERAIGTLRRERLDRLLIFGRGRLAAVLTEYVVHYNGHRPHRSLGQCPPEGRTAARSPDADPPVLRRDRLGGLIHEYELAA